MRETLRRFKSPIALLLLLALLGYGAWWGYQNVIRPIPPVPPAPCVTQNVGAELTADRVTVRVYNGGTTTGLARRVGVALEDKGFKVPVKANASEKVTTTVIVGSNENDPEVRLVAGFFINATIKADGRIDHTVDVLVGNEFGGMEMAAPVSLPVPSGTVCLPATPTPTPDAPAQTPAEGATAPAAPAPDATPAGEAAGRVEVSVDPSTEDNSGSAAA